MRVTILSQLTASAVLRRQSGVLPWRERDGNLEVMLISKKGGGWGIPKGGLEPGLSKRENAAKEAREEAGILGIPKKKLGTYTYVKSSGQFQHVVVYAMKVKQVMAKWDESVFRRRRWFIASDARRALPEQVAFLVDELARHRSRKTLSSVA